MNRADSNDFRTIFLNDIPMIDTRAPVEFNRGTFPASVSLPLMTDHERMQVGTCYKQKGQAAAIALGHQLVNSQTKIERVERWLAFARQNPNGYLYCWRGGLRSQICQQWMYEAGCDYPRIKGGYKAMRQFLLTEFERICHNSPLLILAGKTGCNKTDLLNEFSNSVDLEHLANHRGSSFGRRPNDQPSQLNFENALAIELYKVDQRETDRPVIMEDESRLIGRCSLPFQLRRHMDESPLILLESPMTERVHHTYHNYILTKLSEWQQFLGQEQGFESFASDLRESLFRIRKRLGGLGYQDCQQMLEDALNQHRQGQPQLHRQWIHMLLEKYYDPMYEYQLSKKLDRVIFRGNRDEVREYLAGC